MINVEIVKRRVARACSWCVIIVVFFCLQLLDWDVGFLPAPAASLAATSAGQGEEADESDTGQEDDGSSDDQDDGSEDDAGEEPDDDDGDDGDDGGDDDGDDDGDDRGGDGEDALDSLSDDGDNDDDSEPDKITSICSESMSLQKKMSVDGLCSTAVGSTVRNRLGFIGNLTRLAAETVDGADGDIPGPVTRGVVKGKELAGTASVTQYAPLPEYENGDIYVYSDGSWEQVVTASHERVEWQNHYGNRSVGVPDFTYKRSEWQTSTRVGVRRFAQTSYLFDESTTTLWPLTAKSKTRYDEKGKWIGKDGIERIYDSFWRCDVRGRERVTVAAGEFDTWRIACSRYRDSYSFPKTRAREYKTWYYAPSVEHWVLRTRDNRGLKPDTRKELVAIIPDLKKITRNPQALVQVQQQFQEVLETTTPNQRDLWIAAEGDTVISMTPGAVYVGEDGLFCRQYTQEIEAAAISRRYQGIGCRTPDGTWYIPRR